MIWLVILYSKTNPRLCAFYSWTNKAKGNIYILASSLHPPKFNPIHICYLDTGSMCTVLAVRCVEMDSASHQEHYVLMGTWWNIILDPVEEKHLISNSHFCFSTFPSKQKGGQLKRKAPRHWCKLSIRPDGILPTRCGLLLGGGIPRMPGWRMAAKQREKWLQFIWIKSRKKSPHPLRYTFIIVLIQTANIFNKVMTPSRTSACNCLIWWCKPSTVCLQCVKDLFDLKCHSNVRLAWNSFHL